jgi:hypothetical protein
MQIILIAIFSYWFVEITKIPSKISLFLFKHGYKKPYHGKYIPRRIKPLDCEVCLAFWIYLWFDHASIQSVLLAALCSFMARLIYLLTNLIRPTLR